MSNDDARAEILAAAAIDDPRESEHALKSIVARTLDIADQDARVMFTSEFNHTYIPDLVLEWPRESSRASRPVYIRSNNIAAELAEDIVLLRDKKPILFHLSDLDNGTTVSEVSGNAGPSVPDDSNFNGLDEVAESALSLVTSVGAMSEVAAPKSQFGGALISPYLVRGGRGFLGDTNAQKISTVAADGLDGAMSADMERTRKALGFMEEILDVPSANDFKRLLEVAWVNGGANPLDFPGGVLSIGDRISPDRLLQLIRTIPEASTDFWLEIAERLELESLETLHLIGDQPQLQVLIPAAIRNFRARACVVHKTVRGDQESDPFVWQVDRGNIQLRGGGHSVWVLNGNESPSEQGGGQSEPVEPPSLRKLADRAENGSVRVVGVHVSDDARTLSYLSNHDENILAKGRMETVTDELGSSSLVERALVRTSDDRQVSVRFDTSTAAGHTNTRFDIRELMTTAWSLMAESSDDQFGDFNSALDPAIDEPVWPTVTDTSLGVVMPRAIPPKVDG